MFIFQSPALVTLVCIVLPGLAILGTFFAMTALINASDSDDELLGDRQYWGDWYEED